MPMLALEEYQKEQVILNNLSVEFMRQARFYPFAIKDNRISIVMADPDDFYTIEAIELGFGLKVDIYSGVEEEILEAIETGYGSGSQSVEKIIEEMGRSMPGYASENEEDISHLKDLA
ncbi:MAG: type II secretion system protein GspE, partial [Desulfosarcina sp.]|nr:type II secretion system protein GspE [Desulfobacterales bacterium]